MTIPERWRLVETPASRAHWNMAFDAALQARAATGAAGFIRVYSWSHPAVSFGRNEPIRGRYAADDLARAGLDAVRRPTGGRALLHVEEVTYTVAMPLSAGVPWRHAYDFVNRRLCAALQSLGVPAVLQAEQVDVPLAALCFAAPASGEIVAGGAKLVGSAVWRDAGSYLQQGSIIVDGNQELLRGLSRVNEGAAAPVATLRQFGAQAGVSEVAAALEAQFGGAESVERWRIDDNLQRDADSRVKHFEDDAWLWRR